MRTSPKAAPAPDLFATFAEEQAEKTAQAEPTERAQSIAETHYGHFLHPNQISIDRDPDEEEAVEEKKSEGCSGWFFRMDITYLKPFLVYKFNKLKNH